MIKYLGSFTLFAVYCIVSFLLKGPVLSWINAIEAYQQENVPLPVNIKVMTLFFSFSLQSNYGDFLVCFGRNGGIGRFGTIARFDFERSRRLLCCKYPFVTCTF